MGKGIRAYVVFIKNFGIVDLYSPHAIIVLYAD